MKRLIPVILSAAFASAALAQGTINHGNATYTFDNSSGTYGLGSLRPEGGTTTDHLYQTWWYYRVQGETRETQFQPQPAGQVYSGNVATLSDSDPSGAGRFRWEIVRTLTDGGNAGEASLIDELRVSNTSGQALSMALFSYADFDVNGSAGGDVGTLITPNSDMEIRDVSFVRYVGFGAQAYQVTGFATLRGLLQNTAVDNLNNTGLPFGPGDFTGGYQWNVEINPGETLALRAGNFVNLIPEPATLGLLALGGLALLRRR